MPIKLAEKRGSSYIHNERILYSKTGRVIPLQSQARMLVPSVQTYFNQKSEHNRHLLPVTKNIELTTQVLQIKIKTVTIRRMLSDK